jgi:2-polyprenyl-6-methoxyphenol hydroxylase-like FAD-dependent oxidoreductase
MVDRSDVVVVGGGFVGLTTAAALAEGGARVTVLEALEGPNPAFRGELIHPRGVRTLAALGLADAVVAAGGVRVRGFAVFGTADRNAETGERLPRPVVLPYGEASALGLALDHTCLVDALRRVVGGRSGVRVMRGARVNDVLTRSGRIVGVRVEGGAEHRGALVVAADGRQSRMRRLLGIGASIELVSHSAVLSVDEGVLAEAGHGHVFVDAPGPTLAYPCGHGRARMCIDVPLEAAKGVDRLRAYVRAHYVPGLPAPLRRAMEADLDGSGHIAGAANHAVTTDTCAVPGAALVGDAGGCSHPITAAGMTNGLHDASLLAACVARRGPTDEALLEYQRGRYRYIRTREAFTRALYAVLLGSTPGTRGLRDGLFAYWSGSARSRGVSTAVLSGDDERVATFVVEYLRVVGTASALAAASALSRGQIVAAGRDVGAVLAAGGEAMKIAFEKARSALALEHRASLTPTAAASALARGLDRRTGQRGTEDADDRAPDARVPVRGRDSVEQS